MYFAPPMFSQGKILITRAPSSDAIISSVGVSAPGMASFPWAWAVLMTGTDKPGLTRNCAPASRHSVACSERKTVPAPVSTLSPYLRTTSRITAGAFGTVMVISITGIPPAQMASTACRASSKVAALTTGTIPISPIFFNTSSMFIVLSGVLHARNQNSLASDSRRMPFHHLQNFLQRRHTCIAGSGHRQGAVRRAALPRPLRLVPRQKAINQAGSERVSAANAVQDFQILAARCFIEFSVAIGDSAPVIQRRSAGVAQSRRDNREDRELLNYFFHHALEIGGIELRVAFVHSIDPEAERGGEIFFIAEHHVDKGCQRAIYFLRFRFSSDGFPERTAIIQIVRDDGSRTLGRFHRLPRHVRSRFRQRSTNTAGMKPARAFLDKDSFPIDLAGLEVRNRRVPAIRTSERGAHAKSALGEIQAVADRAADAVVLDPADMAEIDAALEHQILDEASHGIVSEGRDDRSVHAKAAPQAARDVVFAAALPGAEFASSGDARISRIEAQHDLAQADQVPSAGFSWLDLHRIGASSSDASKVVSIARAHSPVGHLKFNLRFDDCSSKMKKAALALEVPLLAMVLRSSASNRPRALFSSVFFLTRQLIAHARFQIAPLD